MDRRSLLRTRHRDLPLRWTLHSEKTKPRNRPDSTSALRRVFQRAMKPNDDDDTDEPTCKTCGQKLALVGSMPKVDDQPRARLYKCIACQVVVAIPPLD